MHPNVDIHIYNECSGKHTHPYPQILVPLQEKMQICVGHSDYEITPQELCFVPPGMEHECNYYGRILTINLSEDVAENRDTAPLTYPLIVSMRGQILQLVDLIQTELRQNASSHSVLYLYKYLYSKLMENCSPPSIRYISEYYHLPITINQLAKIENYNATYYSDWFRQQTGVSPGFYLRCLRINRAKELLSSTNFSVMQIAVMVGYSSNSTFTRAFHSITGMSPKTYREHLSLEKRA